MRKNATSFSSVRRATERHDPVRFEYTVIGDAVNEASRLTEVAKGRESRVLASRRCLDRADAGEAARWVESDTIPLRGRPESTPTCEPRVSVSSPIARA